MTAVVASSADREDEDSEELLQEVVMPLLLAAVPENAGSAVEMAARRLCLSEESDAG